jgi:hypothetical protein
VWDIHNAPVFGAEPKVVISILGYVPNLDIAETLRGVVTTKCQTGFSLGPTSRFNPLTKPLPGQLRADEDQIRAIVLTLTNHRNAYPAWLIAS